MLNEPPVCHTILDQHMHTSASSTSFVHTRTRIVSHPRRCQAALQLISTDLLVRSCFSDSFSTAQQIDARITHQPQLRSAPTVDQPGEDTQTLFPEQYNQHKTHRFVLVIPTSQHTYRHPHWWRLHAHTHGLSGHSCASLRQSGYSRHARV